MNIALQFAMPAELHALPGARDLPVVETVAGIPFFQAAPGVLACAGGVSKVNAAMTAQILCLHFGVDLILNAGVAGCLTDLPTGSLVVASEFVQHDVDTTAVGDPIGLVSTVNRVDFPTWQPEHCAALLAELGYPASIGRWPPATGSPSGASGPPGCGTPSPPCWWRWKAAPSPRSACATGVRFAAVKSVSDHLFSDNQAQEYFDFGEALERLGKIVLPLALKLKEEA